MNTDGLFKSLERFRSGTRPDECFYDTFVVGNLLEGDILWLSYRINDAGPRLLSSYRKTSSTAMPDLVRINGAVIDWEFTYKINLACQWPWKAILAVSPFQARGDMLSFADYFVCKRVFASLARKVGDEYVFDPDSEMVYFPIYDADESFGTMFLHSRENISIQVLDENDSFHLFRGGMGHNVIRDRLMKVSNDTESDFLSSRQAAEAKPQLIEMVGPGHVGKCAIAATLSNDTAPLRLNKLKTPNVSPLRLGDASVQNFIISRMSPTKRSRSGTPSATTSPDRGIDTTIPTLHVSEPVAPVSSLKICVMNVGLRVDHVLDIIHRELSKSKISIPWLILPTKEMLRDTNEFDLKLREARQLYDENMNPNYREVWEHRFERRWPLVSELLLLKSRSRQVEVSVLANLLDGALESRDIEGCVFYMLKNSGEYLKLISDAELIYWLAIDAPPVIFRWVCSYF